MAQVACHGGAEDGSPSVLKPGAVVSLSGKVICHDGRIHVAVPKKAVQVTSASSGLPLDASP